MAGSFSTLTAGFGMSGMDVAEVERIGRQMQTEANNIQQLLNRVAQQVKIAEDAWKGQDATRFLDDWNTRQRQVQAVQTSLDQLGRRALQEAQQQRKVSGVN